MTKHKWHYKTVDELKQALVELGYDIPFSDDLSVLTKPLTIDGKAINNRIVYQPMEAGDALDDGSPGERTIKRYTDFAGGGPGIIWVEAVTVLPEGKSNPGQLYLHKDNISQYKKLVDIMREECFKANKHDTFIIIQLTHTGRYSSPHGTPAPVIAHRNKHVEERRNAEGAVLISDDGLKHFEETIGKASAFAEQAGFDGADIKCCHGYLMQELLCAYERPGPYGGSFENRTRLFKNSIQNAIASTKRPFTITTRMNMYDGYAHPWGFGALNDGTPDLTEPFKLIEMLRDDGIKLLNLSSGSPSSFHITCPRDNTSEHPLEGIGRMLSLTGQIKNAFRDMLIVSSAFSYFREFSPQAIAGSIGEGFSDMVGYGRLSFAYPNAARDIIANQFDKKQMCYCCNSCGYPCRRIKQA